MAQRLASNVIWNWAGMGANMVAGFIVAPCLVHRLGDTVYGLWILIASMSGYFGLLDLGVRSSVGRYVAFYMAKGDAQRMNATVSTAVTLLGGVAILALAATAAILLVFFHLFEVPPESATAVRWAIVIVGVNLALTFPISVFDGVLWGHERFDLINLIDMPTVVARTVLTFWLVRGPGDILALAWITLGSTACNEMAKVVTSFVVDRELRVSVRRFQREQAGQLYGYGLWQFLLQISRQISAQLGPLVIGGLASVAAVTPFSIAARLIGYASQFMVAATGVVTPLATAMHAREENAREQRLFMEGGKWCTAFALYVTTGMLLLGGSFLGLWMGAKTAAVSGPMLLIMVLGEVVAMSQWLAYSMLMGKARHRAVALASLAEGLLAGVGGVIAARYWGAMGVCVIFAAAALLCRGVFQVVYACRVMGVPIAEYVWATMLVPLGAAALPAALLGGAIIWREPVGWLGFVAYGMAFTLVYTVVAGWMLGALEGLDGARRARVALPAMERAHG